MNLKETKVLIFVILLMSTFIIPTSAYASISTTQSIPSNDFLQIISGLFHPSRMIIRQQAITKATADRTRTTIMGILILGIG
ncbi:hypothetical protein RCG23_12205 [Neobacillus sp. PS3-34]|uniref:hypothetical protein n=1 Tax=Neobacillus sp. PS3-34 TaxID=3070678 RepID=UPI0027E2082A|nr:hypothetical protein [Neobacillus sp. PS3-34]WML50406.1 hypothetical protein RCG23_12205 [Neobacillus sp. PS3-34]